MKDSLKNRIIALSLKNECEERRFAAVSRKKEGAVNRIIKLQNKIKKISDPSPKMYLIEISEIKSAIASEKCNLDLYTDYLEDSLSTIISNLEETIELISIYLKKQNPAATEEEIMRLGFVSIESIEKEDRKECDFNFQCAFQYLRDLKEKIDSGVLEHE